MVRVVLVLLALASVTGLEFHRLLAREADKCAAGIWNVKNGANPARNCAQAYRRQTVPSASNTILLPAQQSHSIPDYVTGNFPSNTAKAANLRSWTSLFGRGFNQMATVVSTFDPANPNNFGTAGYLCLGSTSADPSQYCSDVTVFADGADFYCGTTAADRSSGLASPLRWKSDTELIFDLRARNGQPRDWNTEALELENTARPVCWFQQVTRTGYTAGTPIYTGLMAGTVWHCDNTVTSQQCSNRNTQNLPTTALAKRHIEARTSCCGPINDASISKNTMLAVGSCYNPNIQSCCGDRTYDQGVAKCCSASTPAFTPATLKPALAFVDGNCPCFNNSDCPAAAGTCCRATKYSEMTASVDNTVRFGGTCYDSGSQRCCDTGSVFDPGSFQCCKINGLQSLNQPCPCAADADCTGTGSLTPVACCKQSWPAPIETEKCTAYSNYPTGTGSAYVQRCLGTCYDAAFEMCCNGVVCRREFEKCCNSTCCNKYDGSCLRGRREGAPGFRSNYLDAKTIFLQCSTVEALSPVRAILVFVVPAALLLGTLLCLALVLIFANKASARRYSFIERALIVFSVLAILFALPLFFSPHFKYGVVVVVAALVAILTAAARLRWLNIFAIIVLAVAVVYVFDPFFGNFWFTGASGRTRSGVTSPETSGVLHSVGSMWRSVAQATVEDDDSPLTCAEWYDYFRLDQRLLDTDRCDNPNVTTFGYCSRSWTLALLFFSGLMCLFLLLAFILAMLALIVRFRKQRFEPIELEVRGVQPGDEDFDY